MAYSDLLCLALAWTPDRPDDRSWPQPNQWTWDQPGTTVRVRPRRRSPSMMAGRAATVADRSPPPSCSNTIAPGRGQHPPDELVGGDAGLPVGRVDAPQHGPVPEPLGGCQDGRGGGTAGGPEPHRVDPQRLQGAPAPGELVADASRREPIKGLGMPVGVAA